MRFALCTVLLLAAVAWNVAATRSQLEPPPRRGAPLHRPARAGPYGNKLMRSKLPVVARPHGLPVVVSDVSNSSGWAPATVLLHETVFEKIVNTVLPVIIADARQIVIPGKSEKHFSYSDIKLSEFNIDSFTIGFEAPNQVVISLQGLSMAVPKTDFAVFAKVLFVHLKCSGDFSVSVSNTNIVVKFPLIEQNGMLAFGTGAATVSIGSLNVQHEFHDFLCKVGNDIVQLFIGNINNLIKDTIEKDISPMATKALNDAFQKLSAKIDMPLTAAPVATSDSIQISINLLNLPKAIHQQRQKKSSKALTLGSNSKRVQAANRDLEVFIPAASFDAVFDHERQKGRLNINQKVLHANTGLFKHVLPAAYYACENCPLVFSLAWTQPPNARFNGSCTLDAANVIVTFAAQDTGNNTIVSLFSLNLNGTFAAVNFTVTGANQSTVDFKIKILEVFMSMRSTNVGPIAITAIQDVIDFVLQDVVVADFNANFNGLPFTNVGPIQLEDIEVSFASSQLYAGINIELPL